ncbi:hypothetical protein C6P45_004324 [Maudiozyma exigua]|uniref:WH1 domain-containing protein n=1 Tax=Maudiozyma exigua TaxID=34358 RepID=A0A9P6WCV3_MAUEX|nr:hypothetical protein C6P45_004324 [Kazachstania exigua]
MGLLTTQDKEIIKRALPKGSNKILDVAVARLYIAYPDRNKWKFTGLSGALVLVDDLVGNTFFLKLIDIYGHRGIIWDQELYVGFEYYQDRTFFHTFEIEDCFAGFLFVDISEAQHFLKRVQKREKYGSRKTLMNKNAIAMKKKVNKERASNVTHGPRGETIMGDQRKRYNYSIAEHIPETRKKAPPPPPPSVDMTVKTDDDNDDYDNDSYQNFSDEYDNNNSNNNYNDDNYDAVSSGQQSENTTEAEPESNVTEETKTETPTIRHKVPPLPAEFAHPAGQAPPLPGQSTPVPHANNPFPIPVPQPSQTTPFPIPPMSQPNQFAPQLPNAARPVPQAPGGFDQNTVPLPPRQVPQPPKFGAHPQQPQPYGAQPGRVPSFGTQLPPRGGNAPAPPPPRRGPAPPPPPHRHAGQPAPSGNGMMINNNSNNVARPGIQPPASRRGPVPPPPPRGGARPAMQQPGQLPQRASIPAPSMSPVNTNNNGYPIPGMTQSPATGTPPVTTFNTGADVPQVTPPTTFGMPMPQAPQAPAMTQAPPGAAMPGAPSAPPPPPAFLAQPQASAPPPAPAMPGAPGAPPPPPAFLTQPQAGAPPPAPAPPPMGGAAPAAPALSENTGDAGRDALLASIRGAGGISALKKVDKSQLDKPSVLLQEARGDPVQTTSSSAPGGPPGGGPGGSLADALAAALNKRKNKVGAHDDDDTADDW